MICEYCGKEAIHQFKNGKWCCSKNISSCSAIRKEKAKSLKGHTMSEETKKKISDSQKGDKHHNFGKKRSEETKKKISSSHIGKKFSLDHRENISSSLKGREPWNKGKTDMYSEETIKKMSEHASGRTRDKNPFYGKTHTEETKIKISESEKGREPWNKGKSKIYSRKVRKRLRDVALLTIDKLEDRYPFFSKIEDMRHNPDKPGEYEIQVHCKNHLCSNSKEKGGWFTPTKSQITERRRALENPNGNDGQYFYCSDSCKQICPLYRLRSDPYKETEKPYTDEEYQTFRQFVLERDNSICQFCGKQATEVHHERPQKLEPFFALDPDLAWSCCEKCHYEKGHSDECSTGKLATKIC